MKELTIRKDLLNVVKSVENKSSDGTFRVRITLFNDYTLSVISGRGAYAIGSDSYEVAAWYGDGEMDGALIGCDYDSVLGHQTYEDVMGHLNNLAQHKIGES